MKFKSVLLLAVAVSCGLVAMLGVQQVLKGDKGSGSEKQVAKVLVAVAEIAPGTPLDDTNVTFREMPEDAIPEGVVTGKEDYEERALKVRAVPGEYIMAAKLGEKGDFGASNDIPDGMRVITVPVDLTMSASGLIWPGDHVDVLVTYTERGPRLGSVKRVKTVLEYTKVFATDNLRDAAELAESNQTNKTKNISLLVAPEEGEVLKLAEDMGRLHLALRRPGDDTRSGKSMMADPLVRAETGMEAETVKPEPAPSQPEPAKDVREFLDNELQDDGMGADPNDVLKKRMWAIEIYSSGQRRVEEVELPDEPTAALAGTVVRESSLSAVASGAAWTGNPWLDQLKNFFTKPKTSDN